MGNKRMCLALGLILGLLVASSVEAAQFNWQQFKGTQLRVLLNKHPWQAGIEPSLKEFEALTGIKVVLEVYPEDQFRAKTLVELTSGASSMDVFMTMPGVRSRARGELNDLNGFLGDFPNPVVRPNQFSNLPTDVPNRLLIRGNINKLPYGFSVNPLFDFHTGFPYSIQDEEQNFVGVRNSNKTRFPRFASLDLAIGKDIRLLDKYNAQFIVSIFNVTNRNNPRNVRANLGDPAFGQFFANYRRFYRLDFEFTW